MRLFAHRGWTLCVLFTLSIGFSIRLWNNCEQTSALPCFIHSGGGVKRALFGELELFSVRPSLDVTPRPRSAPLTCDCSFNSPPPIHTHTHLFCKSAPASLSGQSVRPGSVRGRWLLLRTQHPHPLPYRRSPSSFAKLTTVDSTNEARKWGVGAQLW